MTLRSLVDRSIVIWGAGIEGQSVARRLLSYGATRISIAIDQPGKRSAEEIDQCTALGLPPVVGDDAVRAMLAADVVIASPSIPPSNALWARLAAEGVRVETTSDLWFAEYGDRALAITGSKGKSTTTMLVDALMRATGKNVALGGNIGVGFFDLPEDSDVYVVEVGHNQCARLTHSPRGGIVTSLFEEHLDWHDGPAGYFAAKQNLFMHGARFVATIPSAMPHLADLPESVDVLLAPERVSIDESSRTMAYVGRKWTLPESLVMPHNARNALLAVLATDAFGAALADEQVSQALAEYAPLPHRLEVVSTAFGMTWHDDSLATSPTPTQLALAAFPDAPIAILLGGQDRGVDYSPLIDDLVARSAPTVVYTIPENGADIVGPLESLNSAVQVRHCASIEDAVTRIAAEPLVAGVVLFSPAAPSGKGYVDYRARSAEFVAAISRIAAS